MTVGRRARSSENLRGSSSPVRTGTDHLRSRVSRAGEHGHPAGQAGGGAAGVGDHVLGAQGVAVAHVGAHVAQGDEGVERLAQGVAPGPQPAQELGEPHAAPLVDQREGRGRPPVVEQGDELGGDDGLR